MNVKELKELLSQYPDDTPVCINDRGIHRDVGAPVMVTHMNGDALELSCGTWSRTGYTVNYNKRTGYEMVLNSSVNYSIYGMDDDVYFRMRGALRKLGCEYIGAESIISLPYDLPTEGVCQTIGPNCKREFDSKVLACAEKAWRILNTYLEESRRLSLRTSFFVGDMVEFNFDDRHLVGKIEDVYSFDNDDMVYNIFVSSENMMYEEVPEKNLICKVSNKETGKEIK